MFWWCSHDVWAFYQFTCTDEGHFFCFKCSAWAHLSKKKHLDPTESHLYQIGRRCWVILHSSTLLSDVSTQPSGNAEGDWSGKLRNLWEDILLPERQQATSTPSSGLSSPVACWQASHILSALTQNTLRSKHPPEPKADTPKKRLAHVNSTHTTIGKTECVHKHRMKLTDERNL